MDKGSDSVGMISIAAMIKGIRKYLTGIVAACLAVGMIACLAVSFTQTYTCSLDFKYTYSAAQEGLAPNGVDKLNPYELEKEEVVSAALKSIPGAEGISAEEIRNHFSISEEASAVPAEGDQVQPTEFKLSYTYSAKLGDAFGDRMLDALAKAYEEFILNKYYNKKHVADFMKSINEEKLDYLDIAHVISENIEDTISYVDEMAEEYPEFRSKRTGYTFHDISVMYQNLRDIQYAKYYGNVRAGNLSVDPKLALKNYNAKLAEASKNFAAHNQMAERYKGEISSFYDSYKASGLYDQALESGANRDTGDSEDDPEKLIDAYDNVVQSYTQEAAAASENARQIEYYNSIIRSLAADTVDQETKSRLIEKNKQILSELTALSASCSTAANTVIDEFFAGRAADDLQYMISKEATADNPALLIVILAMILCGGVLLIGVIVYEIIRRPMAKGMGADHAGKQKTAPQRNPEEMDEAHRITYDQYLNGFNELYLVYQPMIDCDTQEETHFEAFIRWENKTLGAVSPGIIVDFYSELGLIEDLNNWIIGAACRDIPVFKRSLRKMPVIHINCLYSEIIDFGLNEILVRNIKRYRVNPCCLCLELNGIGIASCLESIMTLNDRGIKIGIDHFEDSYQEKEIIDIIEPSYVKMSSDVFMQSTFATTEHEMIMAVDNMITYFSKVIERCHKKGIDVCICGVETRFQDNIVSQLGFKYKQGYYYKKPVRLEEYLKDHNKSKDVESGE